MGCHFLLQEIFLTQGSNPGLLHCRQMLYRLSHQENLLTPIICTTNLTKQSCLIYMVPWWLRWSRIHLQCRRPGFDPWVGKIPWRRERLPTILKVPVFWFGEFHGLCSHKESDTTERLSHRPQKDLVFALREDSWWKKLKFIIKQT